MKVSVIGLGKLGAPLAVSLAAGGLEVYGAEQSPHRLELLARDGADLGEPDLARMLAENSSRLHLGGDTAAAVAAAEVTFMIVPTPSHPLGHFDLSLVLQACRQVGEALARKEDGHVVVLVSTVMPSDCADSIIPALESASGKRCGQQFGFCYNPAFIALGSVIRDLRNPDMVLIGESDTAAGSRLVEVQQKMCLNQPPMMRTQIVNAEIAKLSLNTYVTMKISFANTLARLCMQTPQADARQVGKILGHDSRIGGKYLQPGLAYGGPCFPRDTGAFEAFARSKGLGAPLAQATARVNQEQKEFLVDWTLRNHRQGPIAVLGLAYKPGTPVCEESPGLALCQSLLEKGLKLRIFDPEAACDLPGAVFCRSALECIETCEVVVLTTAWPEFSRLPGSVLAGKVVLDCWSLLDPATLPSSCHYQVLGENLCQEPQLS